MPIAFIPPCGYCIYIHSTTDDAQSRENFCLIHFKNMEKDFWAHEGFHALSSRHWHRFCRAQLLAVYKSPARAIISSYPHSDSLMLLHKLENSWGAIINHPYMQAQSFATRRKKKKNVCAQCHLVMHSKQIVHIIRMYTVKKKEKKNDNNDQ